MSDEEEEIGMEYEGAAEEQVSEKSIPDFVIREDIYSEMHEAVQLQHHQTEMGIKVPGIPN